MVQSYTYKSLQFFLITFFISWTCGAFAIYASWNPTFQHLLVPFFLAALSGPMLSAFIMLFKSRNIALWNDFFQRLRPSSIKEKFVPLILLLFPCAIVLAFIVSIFFGQPIQQLSFIPESGDTLSHRINLLALAGMASLSGPFEEIGWRGYGMDSLLSKWSLIKASLLFAALWGLFHVPAFFISGLQAEFWSKGLFHIFLYFTTLFFLTIIINWLYVKNNRSILAAIFFHSIADMCLALFHLTPVTWFILWVILLLISLVIIYRDKNLFFGKI